MEVILDTTTLVEVIHDTGVGPQGAKGEQGLSGGASMAYEHVQLPPLVTWVINHNLGFKPTVTAYTVGGMMMWANVQHWDNNQARILFDRPTSGYAVCS